MEKHRLREIFIVNTAGITMLLSSDAVWKIFTTALGIIITPLAACVWSVNVEVVQITNKNLLMESKLC